MSVSSAATGNVSAQENVVTVAVPDGAQTVTLPAGTNLADAQFVRHGGDLEIVLPDGRHIVLPDFFDGSGSPALTTADGQSLPADLVARLAGPVAPGQFAQADGGTSGLVQVGMVDKLSGTVTVRHADGTTGTLSEGGPIYQGDIIETSPSGAVGIVLADRSTFSLGTSGRMVMDELVYDPKTQDGHASMSVLKGTFSFVSGQIAHAGPDAMQVRTPVMTIGVRGTTVAGQVGDNGQTSVALVGDPSGGVGQITLSNSMGTQVLSQPNSMVTLQSAFTPFAPPVIVPPGVISSTFGSAINSLPVPPTQNNMEWNTVPGQNQPAPVQQIQSRPEAGSSIQVDSPGGNTQVVPAAPKETAPQNTAPQETAPQSTAPQETAPQNTAPQETAPSSTTPQGGADAGDKGATNTASGTGTGTTATGTTETGTGTPAPVGNGNPGGGTFTWYTSNPIPQGNSGAPVVVTTISEVLQNTATANGSMSSSTPPGSEPSNVGEAGATSSGEPSAQEQAKTVIEQGIGGESIVGTGPSGSGSSTADQVKQAIEQVVGNGATTTDSSASNNPGTTTPTNNNNTPSSPVNTTPSSTSGRLVDGPIRDARVFLDVDGDSNYDTGEPIGYTDANGYYTLAGAGAHQIVALHGGVDTVTGQVIQFDMKAPAGSTIVSPLTTLVAEMGEAAVKTMLGITSSASLLTTDPMTTPEIHAAGVQLVATINALKNGLSGNPPPTHQQVLNAMISVMRANPSAEFLTNTNMLESVVTATGAVPSYTPADFLNHVAQASTSARSDPTALANINPVPTAGGVISVNTADAVSVDVNIAVLKAGGLTSFNLMSGVGSLTAAEASGVTFTYSTGSTASMGVSDSAANIGAYETTFSGLKTIAVSDGQPVYYSEATFVAHQAITTGTTTFGLLMSNGGSTTDWSESNFAKVDLVKFASGAAVTMSAAQIDAVGAENIDKNGGSLAVSVSGDIRGLDLLTTGPAYVYDSMVLSGNTTMSLGQYEKVVSLFGDDFLTVSGFSVTVDGGAMPTLSLTDTALIDYLILGGTTINLHDGASVDANFSALQISNVTNFALTSGALELSVAEGLGRTVTTSGTATYVVADTAANLGSKLGAFSGATGYRVTEGDLSIDLAKAASYGAIITRAAGANVILSLVSEQSTVGLTGFNQISLSSGYAFVSGAHILALGASNILLTGGAFIKAVVSGNVVGNDYSPATVLYLSGDVILSVAQRLLYNDGAIYENGHHVSLSGVSGDVSTLDFANLHELTLSDSATWTMAQQQALQASGATITANGHAVTLTQVHGVFDLDPAILAHVDTLVLSEAVLLDMADYTALLAADITIEAGTGAISLTGVSGVLAFTADELALVLALEMTGDTTLTLAQFNELAANGAFFAKDVHALTVNGVSGSLGLDSAALADIDVLVLSAATTFTYQQFVALQDYGVSITDGGYAINVTNVSGDLTDISVAAIDSLTASADVTMSLGQRMTLKTNGATFNMAGHRLSLNGVEGELTLSETELGDVYGMVFSGDVSLTLARFNALMMNEASMDKGNGTYDLTVTGISGTLSLSGIAQDMVDVIGLGGNLSLTFTQLQDLLTQGVTFDKDSYTLTVTDVVGDLTGLDLSAVDALVTSGDITLRIDQVGGLDVTGSGTVTTTFTNVSSDMADTFQAEAGSHVQFHGNVSDYRFSGDGGNLLVSDLRESGVSGYDNLDTIQGVSNLSGGMTLHFADATASIASDGDVYLDFSNTTNTVHVGGGLDMVRLNGGDDTLVLTQESSGGMNISGGSGSDTILAQGDQVDLRTQTLGQFEIVKTDGSNATVLMSAAQASGKTFSGADGILSAVVMADASGNATLASSITLTQWDEGDSLIFRGRKDLADIMGGTNAAARFELSGDDQANGGIADDTYVLQAGGNPDTAFAGDIVITDAGGSDTLDVRALSENTGKDYGFDGALRVGDDLVLYLDPANGIGGGTITLKDHFNGKAVERLQTESSGADMYEYLASGLTGSALDDMIFGSNNNAGAEVLTGGGGHDQFFGGGGLDTFVGDGGDTVHYGELGAFDSATGGLIMSSALDASGNGTATLNDGLGGSWTQTYQGIGEIVGTDGTDQLYGWAAPVGGRKFTLNGGLGNDVLWGGAGTIADYSDVAPTVSAGVTVTVNYSGGEYRGTVTGASGTDTTHDILHFVGSAFNDTFNGSDANETFQGNGGSDIIQGGAGSDTITFTDGEGYGVTVNLGNGTASDGFGDSDSLSDIENVIGSDYSDDITGSDSVNVLDGGDGADSINGGAGADTLIGGFGADTLTGGDGDDIFTVSNVSHSTLAAPDVITDFGSGIDRLSFSGASGYAYNASVTTAGAADLAAAIALVVAGTVNNTIAFFTWDGDGYVYVRGTGTGTSYADTLVKLQGVTAIPSFADGNLLVSQGGTSGNDVIYGTTGNDTLAGGGGNDIILAGDGDDTLAGGTGADTLNGGAGIDFADFSGASANVTVQIGATGSANNDGGDTLASIEGVIGSSHHDLLVGSTAAETFIGGQGGDILSGGGGADSFILTAASQSDQVNGHDVIADFGNGNDRIVFQGAAGYAFAAITISPAQADLAAMVDMAKTILAPNTIGYFTWDGDGYLYVNGSGSGSDFDGAVIQLTGLGAIPQIIDGNTIALSTDGNDVLTGSGSIDVINGAGGDDQIRGGGGADILTGGSGNDTFLYDASSDGVDVITDFTAGGSDDSIDIGNLTQNTAFQHVSTNGVVQASIGVLVLDDTVASGSHLLEATVMAKLNGMSGFEPETSTLFLLSDGSSTAMWKWADADGSASVDSGELTQIATLNGVTAANLTVVDFIGAAASANTPSAANDFLVGTAGSDDISAGDGDDVIVSVGGDDIADGGLGNDTIYVSGGDLSGLTIAGGGDMDSLVVMGSGTVTLDALSLSGVERIMVQGSQPGTNHVGALVLDGAMLAANALSIEQNGLSMLSVGTNVGNGGNEIAVTIDASGGGDLTKVTQGLMVSDASELVIDGQLATTLTATVPAAMCSTTVLGGTGGDSISVDGMVSDFAVQVVTGGGHDTVTVNDAYVNHNGEFDGGSGVDTLNMTGGAQINGGIVKNFEVINLAQGVNTALNGTVIDGGDGANALEIDIAGGAFSLDGTSFTNWTADDSIFIGGSAENDTIQTSLQAATIAGGGGDDVITGSSGDDVYLFSNDVVGTVASLGTDTITDFGATDKITLDDRFFGLGSSGSLTDGGNYFESVTLAGSYGSGAGIVVVGSVVGSQGVDIWYTSDLSNVSGANSHKIASLSDKNTGTVAASQFTLTTIVSTSPTSGNDVLTGTAGADVLTGLDGDDTINGLGGRDNIDGGHGDDTITVTGIVAGSSIFGGTGYDSLNVVGSGDVVMGDIDFGLIETVDFVDVDAGNKITSVTIQAQVLADNLAWSEGGGTIDLMYSAGTDMDLIIDAGSYSDLIDIYDAMYVSGFDRLVTDASQASTTVFAAALDGLAEQTILSGSGDDQIEVMAGVGIGESLEISSGAGADTIFIGNEAAKRNTVIDGGDGVDSLVFSSYARLGMDGNGATVRGVEVFDLSDSLSADALKYASIDGSGVNTSITVNVAHASHGQTELSLQSWGADDKIALMGSSGNDILTGAVGDDLLVGDQGNDVLTGGGGADLFLFSRSGGASFGTDTITDFDAAEGDKIGLDVAIMLGLGGDGVLDVSKFFRAGDLSEVSGSGSGIIVVGSGSGDGGVQLWYAGDLSDAAGSSSYQIANISGANTNDLSNSSFINSTGTGIA